MVTQVVSVTPREFPDLRKEQCELIAKHLAEADMTVRIGQDDAYVAVEFPGRPLPH